jgi:hypothetical protein
MTEPRNEAEELEAVALAAQAKAPLGPHILRNVAVAVAAKVREWDAEGSGSVHVVCAGSAKDHIVINGQSSSELLWGKHAQNGLWELTMGATVAKSTSPRTGGEVAREAFEATQADTHAEGEPWQAAADAVIADAREDTEDDQREALKNAFVAGCEAVHNNPQEDRDPDFTEAGYDYASSIAHHERPKVSAGELFRRVVYPAPTWSWDELTDTDRRIYEARAQAFLTAYAAAREAGDVE